jgi:hypothetical protein
MRTLNQSLTDHLFAILALLEFLVVARPGEPRLAVKGKTLIEWPETKMVLARRRSTGREYLIDLC